MLKSHGAASYLRHWMKQVMHDKEWNAQEWAVKAGTSPTNITRFLKGSDHIPSYQTLVKLAGVAGVAIPTPGMTLAEFAPKVRMPLLNHSKISKARTQDLPKLLQATRETTVASQAPQAFAVRLDTGEFAGFGFNQGDVIVIDPDYTPESGNHVFVHHDKRLVAGLFKPPYVIFATAAAPTKVENTSLVGTIVGLIRSMVALSSVIVPIA